MIKIGRLKPEILRNMFERIQIMKKSRVCTAKYVHSNPNALLLTSRGPAGKNQKLFGQYLTLKLTQEPKNAIKPREITYI